MRRRLAEQLGPGAAFLLLVLPWTQPFSSGPSRNAWPWLISAACLAGLILLRRQVNAPRAAQALLAAALLNSAMALAQYAGWAHQLPFVWPAGPGEGFGNLRQRNQFGSLTAMGLCCLLAWIARVRQGGTFTWPAVLALPALLLLAAGNAASQSRTGLMAWALVALAFAWFGWRQGRRCVVLALLALLLAVLLSMATTLTCAGGGCGAVSRLADAGSDSRWVLWTNVLTLIAQRPWTGWGWGELDYAHFMTLYPGERFTEKLGNAHNLPLHLAAELGGPAALLACAVVLLMVGRSRPWAEQRPWQWGAWCVLGVIMLHSLVEYPLWYGPFQITVLLCVVFLWRTRSNGPAIGGAWRQNRLADGVGWTLLGLVAWMGADYWRVSQPFLPAAQRSAWWADDPLGHARRSGWYAGYADFATLVRTPVTQANAQAMHRLALKVLHHSAEPLVIEQLLASSRLLGREEEVAFYTRRYQAAFPQAHAAWLARQRQAPSPAPAP